MLTLEMFLGPWVVGAVATLLCWVVWEVFSRRHSPPGPFPLPIIGNASQLSRPLWKAVARWVQNHGPIVYGRIFGQDWIIVSSFTAANELLNQQSWISSGRPGFILASLMGWDPSLPMSVGERAKKLRQLLHKTLNPNILIKYDLDIQRSAVMLVSRLSEHPHDALSELRRTVNIIIMRVAYGFEVSRQDAPYLRLTEEALKAIEHSTQPDAWTIAVIPFLRFFQAWFPALFQILSRHLGRDIVYKMLEGPFLNGMDRINSGKALPSMLSDLMEGRSKCSDDDKDLIMWAAASALLAGSSATISALSTFILAMVLFPDVQRKAQAEIDSVIGDRLPEFADRPSLPYIDCILKEIYRWQPSAPLGFPHVLDKDCIYKNRYQISAGTIITANVMGILHDGAVYDSPEEFIPERHEDGGAPDPTTITFGFGRRACPGITLANKALWMNIVMILATLDLSCPQKLDGSGSSTSLPKVQYRETVSREPLPFDSVARPRSVSKVELIQKSL